MGHSKKLLQACAELLHKQYPPWKHEYIFEQGIPGKRVLPDIQVCVPGSKMPICVVEIGYTRASKIAKYRELKIPDVRWYSKSLNLVLHEGTENIEERLRDKATRKAIQSLASEIRERMAVEVLYLFQNGPVMVPLQDDCSDCIDVDGISPDECDCGTLFYFDHIGYAEIFECELNTEHDYTREYRWDDEEGPWHNEFGQFLEIYLEYKAKMDACKAEKSKSPPPSSAEEVMTE